MQIAFLFVGTTGRFDNSMIQIHRFHSSDWDGDEVDAVVILPPGYHAGQRYGVIVDLHPIPRRDEFYLSVSPPRMGQVEAALGYVVFLPSVRSPHTPRAYSRNAEYNEKARGAQGIPIMIDDFTSGVKALIDKGIADPDRIGIYGHSNGGWVVNYLVTETRIPRCAVVWSGSSDVIFQEHIAE